MRKRHPKNERIKRDYLVYLSEAKGMSPKSVDQAAAAINQFEASTGFKDFRLFHIEQARKFKRMLIEERSPETGKVLAKATAHARLMAVKAFCQWLAGQPGYKSKITYADAQYFNPTANDTRIATATRQKPVPSIEQIRHVISAMPTDTDIQKRNRALIAFALLSGARDDAMASLSIKHVDLITRTVFQDARTVRTKNRKTITSSFFPVGADLEAIVEDWIAHLTKVLLFGPDDPLFPATKLTIGETGGFEASGLDRRHWTTAGPIRQIFKDAFEAVGLPYFNPHSFRDTLTLLGERMGLSHEAMKAWSQNLGHTKLLTTLMNYGPVTSHRQAEILGELRSKAAGKDRVDQEPDAVTIQRVLAHLASQSR